MELNSFYKTELSPKELFNSMKDNIYKFSSNVTSYNSKYLHLRSKLLNLLRQVSSKMCFKSQTYFLSIYYLDIVFTINKNKKIDCNYNIMALACLLLSAKYCENDPIVPELKYFTKIYNRLIGNKSAISVSDLFYSEVMTIKLLNHKLNYYTIYDFNSFFFNNNILTEEQLKNIDNNIDIKNNNIMYNNNNKISIKIKKVYEKIYRLSRYYLDLLLQTSLCIKYSSLLLSIFILKKSLEYILLTEKCNINNIDSISKERFIIKTNNYFNRIIKGYYEFDYENIPEYQKLLNEYDIIQIFSTNKNNQCHSFYNMKPSKTLTSFNKKEINTKIKKEEYENNIYNKINNKEIDPKTNDINYSSSKLNLHKLNSSNSINNKIQNFNTINNYSNQNIPFVSNNNTIQNETSKNNHKNFKRNLGIDNCKNSKYDVKKNKEPNIDLNNYFSENVNNMRKTVMNVFSPGKIINSDKKIINIIKRTKSKEYEKENYDNLYINDNENTDNNNNNNIETNGRLTFNINNIANKNINALSNMNKPYYKKVVQNYSSKLNNKNINQISNKHNFDNININPELKNTCLISNKINNKFISKYELNTETKAKYYTNKKFNYKDFITLNLNKDFKEKCSYSNNKDKKISKILHINLNPKFIEGYSPLNSLYMDKKNHEEIFSSTAYIHKTNIKNKKHESKTSKSINNFENLINKRRNNNLFNIQNENQLKNYKHDSDEYIENKNMSNKLAESSKVIGFPLMKSKREKNKDKLSKNKNKIFLTENALSGDENPNKINTDISLNEFIKAKKIEVKKNKFDNELKNRFKKIKNDNLLSYHGYTAKNLDENFFKKNTSTIVINNNININFGNKTIKGYKESKKFGQNSISSLLNKIPLCYKTEEN